MTKTILFFLVILTFTMVSCNKGCDFPADVNSGIIVQDAIVYGGNTGGIATVHGEESLQYDLKMSLDNGYSYAPVNFNLYTVLNFPIVAGCNTHYDREVTVNGSTVKYKIIVESCPDCEEEYRTDNWVLVEKSKLPASFTVDYEKTVQ